MKVLQFGEGNFLRCFLDWMLQKMADATGKPFEAILVQPMDSGIAEAVAEAGSYHVLLRGYENGAYREVLEPVRTARTGVNPFKDMDRFLTLGTDPDVRVLASNTTEAGIFHEAGHVTPHNFASLLAVLLHKRQQAGRDPMVLMPMELIEHNADRLKECVLAYGKDFGYGPEFADYVSRCPGYNSLVDRIVPGFPADAVARLRAENHPAGNDPFLTSGELFHLLVLEGNRDILSVLPFDKAGLNVIVTPDRLAFYRDRKVRVLNGAHTAAVPVALFAGLETVHEFVDSPAYADWIRGLMHEEICFALDDSAETHAYADEVLARFRNPALNHKFRSIALNSIAKTGTRLRPTLEAYWEKTGAPPPRIAEAVRAMIRLYSTPDGVCRDLPGGELILGDFADAFPDTSLGTSPDTFTQNTTTPSPAVILNRLFPGLDPALAGAILMA